MSAILVFKLIWLVRIPETKHVRKYHIQQKYSSCSADIRVETCVQYVLYSFYRLLKNFDLRNIINERLAKYHKRSSLFAKQHTTTATQHSIMTTMTSTTMPISELWGTDSKNNKYNNHNSRKVRSHGNTMICIIIDFLCRRWWSNYYHRHHLV